MRRGGQSTTGALKYEEDAPQSVPARATWRGGAAHQATVCMSRETLPPRHSDGRAAAAPSGESISYFLCIKDAALGLGTRAEGKQMLVAFCQTDTHNTRWGGGLMCPRPATQRLQAERPLPRRSPEIQPPDGLPVCCLPS